MSNSMKLCFPYLQIVDSDIASAIKTDFFVASLFAFRCSYVSLQVRVSTVYVWARTRDLGRQLPHNDRVRGRVNAVVTAASAGGAEAASARRVDDELK